MQKRAKLAAIVDCLSKDELANLSPHAALLTPARRGSNQYP